MSKRTHLLGFAACLFLVVSLVGCGSGQTSVIEQDEITTYLNENPEAREIEHVSMEEAMRIEQQEQQE